VTTSRVEAAGRTGDARLTVGVAAACVAAFLVFVVVPYRVVGFEPPAGVDALWAVGGLLTIVLGPVAAGLAGFVSLAALWTQRDAPSATTRRLHVVTLLLVAVVWVALLSDGGSAMVAWWLD
jgi:hypothetical protein